MTPHFRTAGSQAPAAPEPERITLEAVGSGAAALTGNPTVRIWSGEWHAYWCPNKCGYTTEIEKAGLYSFDEAYRSTRHCGPEKHISYEIAPEPRDLAELADECGTLVTGLRCAADHLALDADWEIAEPRAASDALSRLEPLAERLASVIADLKSHKGGNR